MTTRTTLHPLAERYVKELRRRARDLPRSRRDELSADIEAHLAETAPAGVSEAEVRTVVLLFVGGVLIPVVGWVVGVLLLWVSRAWTIRDKIVGTLVLPGGLLPAVWLVIAPVTVGSCGPGPGGKQVCTGGVTTTQQTINIAFFAVAVVLPFCTALYLARRAQRQLAAR